MNRDTRQEPVVQTVAESLHQHLQKGATAPDNTAGRNGRADVTTQVRVFRPTSRQPLAVLTILDDGSREEGEAIRIRSPKFSIGRDSGDVQMPFDTDMSGKHAELRCQKRDGRFRWYLIDRKSTNGTFVRGFRAMLSKESELMIGGRRYRFRQPEQGDGAAETAALQTQAYRAPNRTMVEQFMPQLKEIGVSEENAPSFSIGGSETIVGSDPKCQITIKSDPFVSPRHARFYQDERERWVVEDQKSLNGVWIRVKRFPMDKTTEFQLGQQRFRFNPRVG